MSNTLDLSDETAEVKDAGDFDGYELNKETQRTRRGSPFGRSLG